MPAILIHINIMPFNKHVPYMYTINNMYSTCTYNDMISLKVRLIQRAVAVVLHDTLYTDIQLQPHKLNHLIKLYVIADTYIQREYNKE